MRFNPQSNAWSSVPTDGAPAIAALVPGNHAAIWDGKELIVFGAVRLDNGATNSLTYAYRVARYAPPGGDDRSVPTNGTPSA